MNISDLPLGQYSGLNIDGSRLTGCIARGTAQIIRLSSEQQRENFGSLRLQRGQLEFLVALGAQRESIRSFELIGESAKAGAKRPGYWAIVDEIREGRIGLLGLVDTDRAARSLTDAEALFDAIADVRGLLVVNGDMYDPGNPAQRFLLSLRAVLARWENDQRAFRIGMSRLSKAKALEAQIKPAVGLVWVDPADLAYRARLEEHDLDYYVSPEMLKRHHELARGRNEVKRLLLPCPDPDVLSALTLVLMWFRETKSIAAVLDRIESDPRWPRPGCFPRALQVVWNPDEPLVKWVSVFEDQDGVQHGRRDLAMTKLYDWLTATSVYGIYSFTTSAVKEAERLKRKEARRGKQRA